MKIVVIGGSGLIRTKLVERLRNAGREVLAASPDSGVNTITGEGLSGALKGAQVVVDVSNSPLYNDKAVMEFFETSTRNLLAAETAAAGVAHHVLLSIVGTDRLAESAYYRAKLAQEQLIEASGVPYTTVRSTHFFEFLGGIAQSNTDSDTVRLSPAYVQPIAADNVADALADVGMAVPVNDTIEIAGPTRFRLADLVAQYLAVKQDPRHVIPDVHARYFGAELNDASLVPGERPRLGTTTFDAGSGGRKRRRESQLLEELVKRRRYRPGSLAKEKTELCKKQINILRRVRPY